MAASAPFGLLLDVDGPIANTVTRTLRIDSIADDLAALANAGVPVVFNTGRSDAFLAEVVLPRLHAAGMRADAPVWGVCEKGATWFGLDAESGVGELGVDAWAQVPEDLRFAVRRFVEDDYADTMFWDETKHTMISVEQRLDVGSDAYLAAQAPFVASLQLIVDGFGLADDFHLAPSIISVDVEHRGTGKALGAERALALVAERMPVPALWRTAGDSRSDYAMADWLHDQGYAVEHLDVRAGEGVPDVPYPVLHDALDDPAALGEDELTARHLRQWRTAAGL